MWEGGGDMDCMESPGRTAMEDRTEERCSAAYEAASLTDVQSMYTKYYMSVPLSTARSSYPLSLAQQKELISMGLLS